MAKARRAARSERTENKSRELSGEGPEGAPGEGSFFGSDYAGLDTDASLQPTPGTTGRKIVTILSDDPADRKKVLDYLAARDVDEVVRSVDFEEAAIDVDQAAEADAVVLDELPIIILNESPNLAGAISAGTRSLADEDIRRLFVVEDDMRQFPICPGWGPAASGEHAVLGSNPSGTMDGWGPGGAVPAFQLPPALSAYQQGYLSGVHWLSGRLLGSADGAPSPFGLSPAAALSPAAHCFQDASVTWGLQATHVDRSNLTGRGIRVAILDTGFEFGHPDRDFAARVVARGSFVGGTAQDDVGHGTHVTGTACGPRNPGSGIRRYGVAGEAEILVGKVLARNGGSDSSVLHGINWAIAQGCHVINMSLGPNLCQVHPPFATQHEIVARTALRRGVLIVAAAGNASRRSAGRFCPVVGPAAAPSVVAVAAVDPCGRVADFSNRGLDQTGGGEVNFAAPGVSVYSAWTNPARHQDEQGTSMAAPHVAGIAALIAQETGLRGMPLYREMRRRAVNIGGDSRDVGNGFIRV